MKSAEIPPELLITHTQRENNESNNIPKSNLTEELVKEMELPEIFQGLHFASSGDNGLALTVT